MRWQALFEKVKRWGSQRYVLFGLWLAVGLVAALAKMSATRHNNFDIFRYVWYNTLQGVNLYAPSTDGGFWDTNHYGPFFSLLIAPFAIVPVWAGLTLWCVSLSMLLYVAVRRSTLTWGQQVFVLWFCAHELLTALFMQQFNVATAALILFSFWLVERERDEMATFCIVVGTLVKLYGIVGLAFFFFSKHKGRYVASLLVWSVVLFCLPMLYSGVDYQLAQYHEWAASLMGKNAENADSIAQNISLIGMAHRISGVHDFSDLWVIVPGMALFAVTYFRVGQWCHAAFRQTVLASVLMFVCLFSTGTESSGYIIALTGVVVWYTAAPWQRGWGDVALMVFCFVLTSLSPSDLFPRQLRQEWVQPYALKALPVALIWLRLCYEMMVRDYGGRRVVEVGAA